MSEMIPADDILPGLSAHDCYQNRMEGSELAALWHTIAVAKARGLRVHRRHVERFQYLIAKLASYQVLAVEDADIDAASDLLADVPTVVERVVLSR